MCWWWGGVGWGMLTGLLVPVAFRNKCERTTCPKPEPFQSIFPGVNATRTSGTGLERDRKANRNRCEQGLGHQQSSSGGTVIRSKPTEWRTSMMISRHCSLTVTYVIHSVNTLCQIHRANCHGSMPRNTQLLSFL